MKAMNAMSGGINIEDILQQHTVHELRALIAQLEQEGSGKQTELQLMVGSTYHDFIQSADTIASMQVKSKQMNEQLGTFGQLAVEIAEQTSNLLVQAAQVSSSSSVGAGGGSSSPRLRADSSHQLSPSQSQSQSRSQSLCLPSAVSPLAWSWCDITSCRVWSFLDECDVYSACQMIVTAEALLALDTSTITGSDGLIPSSSLKDCLVSRATHLLALSASSDSLGEPLLQRCGGVQYLHQTVVDDCALLFLYGHCDPAESARSMAGLAGLSLCSSALMEGEGKEEGGEVLDGGELLRKYLEGTDLQLQELCQLLRAGGRKEDKSNDRGGRGEDDKEDNNEVEEKGGVELEQLTSVLVSAVHLLQQTIFNVYLIFFKKMRSTGAGASGSGGGEDGLFSRYLVEFLLQCVDSSMVDAPVGKDKEEKDKQLQQRREQLLSVVQARVSLHFPQAAVLTAWRTWILAQTAELQLACVAALDHLNTAPDVAKAQRLTLHQCLHFLPDPATIAVATSSSAVSSTTSSGLTQGHTANEAPLSIRVPGKTGAAEITSGNGSMNGQDEVWSAACGLLLLPFTLTNNNSSNHKRSGGSGGASSGGALLGGVTLWSHVFRKPFITQVEKMLKVSCRDIFHRTKARLLRTVVTLGGSGPVQQPELLCKEREQAIGGVSAGSPSNEQGGRKRSKSSKYASWLVMNPHTLEVKVRESLLPSPRSSSRHEESSPSSSPSSDEWSWVSSYAGSFKATEGGGAEQRIASSAEVFLAAESLRSQLEADLSEYLLTDIFEQTSSSSSGVGQDQDLESSATLARSLQVQCCELVGQVLVLLRVVAANLSAAIASQERREHSIGGKTKRLKAKHGGGGSGSGSEGRHCMWDGEAALQSGLLLISRLAWLLRTPQGAFLEFALQVQQAPAAGGANSASPSPSHAMHHHQQYMTSLEQLQSAFDIADTNGDGVITFAEALEAVNALWITDDGLTAPNQSGDESEAATSVGPSSLEFLWFDTASALPASSLSSQQSALQLHHPLLTYTMPEFRLVCAQMIPPPPVSAATMTPPAITETDTEPRSLEDPAACMHSSLSALVTYSLQTFTDSLLQTHLGPSLLAAMQKDFPFSALEGVPSSAGGSGGGGASLLGSFRCSWQSMSLPAEDGEGEETLDTPVQPSGAAFHFLTGLSQISHTSFLSIDTTQSLSLLAHQESCCCLASTSQDALFVRALEEYLLLMTRAHDQLLNSVAQGGGLQQIFEDYAVQVAFDLALCESTLLAAVTPSKTGSLCAALHQCRDLWEQHIDPINWSLLAPLMKTQVLKYQQRNHMFIPMSADAGLPVPPSSPFGNGGTTDFSNPSVVTIADTSTSSEGGNPKPFQEKQKAQNKFLQLFPASVSTSTTVSAGKKGGRGNSSDSSSITSKFSLLPLPLTSTLAPFRTTQQQGQGQGVVVLALRGGKRISDISKKGGHRGGSQALPSKHSSISGLSSKGEEEHIPGSAAGANGSGSDSKKGKGWFF